MKIPKETMDRWESLRMKGDPDRIVASMGDEIRVHSEVIRVGMRTGEFKNLDVFKAVCAFYNAREIEVQDALKPTNGATNRIDSMAKSSFPVVSDVLLADKQQVAAKKAKPTNTTFLDKRRNEKNKIK